MGVWLMMWVRLVWVPKPRTQVKRPPEMVSESPVTTRQSIVNHCTRRAVEDPSKSALNIFELFIIGFPTGWSCISGAFGHLGTLTCLIKIYHSSRTVLVCRILSFPGRMKAPNTQKPIGQHTKAKWSGKCPYFLYFQQYKNLGKLNDRRRDGKSEIFTK